MPSLITIFRQIPDPRTGNAQRHDLLDILSIALVASVCGAASCVDFAEFAEDRELLLREFLRLENGLARRDTFTGCSASWVRRHLGKHSGRFSTTLARTARACWP